MGVNGSEVSSFISVNGICLYKFDYRDFYVANQFKISSSRENERIEKILFFEVG